jgi:predicted lipoprotein with Yx(FWY)xxD motif
MTIFDRVTRSSLATIGVAAAVVGLAAACSSSTGSGSSPSSSSAPASAATSASAPTSAAAGGAPIAAASSGLGSIVVNAKGFALYDYAPDTATTSACTGQCATFWPPVAAPSPLPTSLPGITGTLTSLTRADGTKQLVLNGHPLYGFTGDKSAGQTNGQGLTVDGGLWLALTPAGAEIPAAAKAGATGGSSSAPSSSASTKSGGGGYGY